MNSKGKLIIIEGIDGSGKETQAKALLQRLEREGYKVKLMDFPQYGQKSAALVEEYLNGTFGTAEEVGPYRASIFYAVDRYAARNKMIEWLKQGCIVLSNRYVSSNKGHQASKIKDYEEREKFLSWVDELEYDLFELPKPDLVIMLHVPADVGQGLVGKKKEREYIKEGKKDIHEKDLSHLKNAEETYEYLVKKYDYWKKIECYKNNSLLSIEDISTKIWNELRKTL